MAPGRKCRRTVLQMVFDYPSQPLQDWLSQRWVMLCGRRVEVSEIPWLLGPFGETDQIGDHYFERLALRESLTIERDVQDGGLMSSMRDLLEDDVDRLHPQIRDFYEHTSQHTLEVWSEWSLLFRPFAGIVQRLYSRRLNQLNLPLRPLDTSRGISSEIVRLRSKSDGNVRYTVWFRRLLSTGRVIYSGIYMVTRIPSGKLAAKIIFPLPRGNATVVMLPSVRTDGSFELVSEGARFGDAGFYFLLRDRKNRHWAQFIRAMRERIHVFVDADGQLRTDHTLSVWGRPALRLHYKISRKPDAAHRSIDESRRFISAVATPDPA
ncbi:MAG: hypothetical protein KF805_03680 [Phycisphaeraceae bacterium]|nr:hypothetical protein [Phycisphaeraceae bacterium]